MLVLHLEAVLRKPTAGKGKNWTGCLHTVGPEVASVTAVQIASVYEAPREDEKCREAHEQLGLLRVSTLW